MNSIRYILAAVMGLIAVLAGETTSAQDPVSEQERHQLVADITKGWDEWETVTISGKLKMAGLPLNPAVKVFMVRDSLVRISIRAPFMGEVGRAEIDTDSILVVNKMKKTYVKEPIGGITGHYPVTLSDLQSLLLGRMVLPSAGTLSEEAEMFVEIFEEDNGEYSLIPGESIELDRFNYGYLIDSSLKPSALLVIPVDNPDTTASLQYVFGEKGYDLSFTFRSPERIYGGDLQLDYPQQDGSPLDGIKINGKYTRLDFRKFMKSF